MSSTLAPTLRPVDAAHPSIEFFFYAWPLLAGAALLCLCLDFACRRRPCRTKAPPAEEPPEMVSYLDSDEPPPPLPPVDDDDAPTGKVWVFDGGGASFLDQMAPSQEETKEDPASTALVPRPPPVVARRTPLAVPRAPTMAALLADAFREHAADEHGSRLALHVRPRGGEVALVPRGAELDDGPPPPDEEGDAERNG